MPRALGLVAIVSILIGGACAPSGENPANRTKLYEPPSGDYRLHYLHPPWELVSASGDTATLRIRSNIQGLMGLEAGPAKYDLTVTVERGTPEAKAASEARAARRSGQSVVAGPRAVKNRDGVSGVEVLTQTSGPYQRNFRYVFFPLGSTRVARLAFEATPSLDTAEVDAMISLFGVGST